MAHSSPAGPAPTTMTAGSGLRVGTKISGCQPRRYSSPAVVFCVHQIGGPPFSQRLTQTLQPMHSRMSSYRPSLILLGKNGSAIEGRGMAGIGGLMVRFKETRRPGILTPVQRADVDVPVIDQIIEKLDELHAFILGPHA